MCPQEFCWGLSTTPLQMGQTNSSFSFITNFKECWMAASSDSQEVMGPGDPILDSSLDSSDLVRDSSDCKLDSWDFPKKSAFAMSLQETKTKRLNRWSRKPWRQFSLSNLIVAMIKVGRWQCVQWKWISGALWPSPPQGCSKSLSSEGTRSGN